MRKLLLSIIVMLGVACATLTPLQTVPSVQLWEDGTGSCTAWAVRPDRWITAAHCTRNGDTGFIDDYASKVLARDVANDLALVAGPFGKPLPVSTTPPPMGAPITTFGYGMHSDVLLVFPGMVIHNATDFFGRGQDEFLVAIANGMPGMSGGPILWRGTVVSVITGGGAATSPAHLVGTGVPWRVLRMFVWEHRGK